MNICTLLGPPSSCRMLFCGLPCDLSVLQNTLFIMGCRWAVPTRSAQRFGAANREAEALFRSFATVSFATLPYCKYKL